jgi:hypothetical protein
MSSFLQETQQAADAHAAHITHKKAHSGSRCLYGDLSLPMTTQFFCMIVRCDFRLIEHLSASVHPD